MDRTNKVKAKISLLFAVNTLFLGVSASYGRVAPIAKTDNLDKVSHEYKSSSKLINRKDKVHITDAFVEDFLQRPHLDEKKKFVLKEKIGQGGLGVVYKAEQDGTEYIFKQAINEAAIEEMENENQHSLDIYNAARELANSPDAQNIHGKLLGLGVIVPVIGTITNPEIRGCGLIQVYANGENLRQSATCVTEEGLRERIDNELQQIFPSDYNKFETSAQDLADRLFDEITNSQTTDVKILVQDYLTQAEKNSAHNLLYKAIQNPIASIKNFFRKYLLRQTLTDSETFRTHCRNVESLIVNLRQNRRTDFFNEHGFPREPKKAIQVLCSFFYALVILHELGYVHCDLKADNVILTRDKIGLKDNTVLKLIDLGALTRRGECIRMYSSNGAPETLDPKVIYNGQILTAQSFYDIYCSVGIILGCLFGYSGLQVDQENFWPTEISESSIYVQRLRDYDFRLDTDDRRFEFFRRMTQNLNHAMGRYGNNYPDSVLNVITRILYLVTEVNPYLRPSAIDVLEMLQELALSDWSSGKFQIQVPKTQVFQEDNQIPSLPPQKKSEKSFLKRIPAEHRRG